MVNQICIKIFLPDLVDSCQQLSFLAGGRCGRCGRCGGPAAACQRERHNGCAGKGEEFASVHLFHGGAPFCLAPLLFRGLWFWHSLHLQSAPSYAILMNRIRSCLLTRFVHSDRLSAPAQDFFWLYCTIPGKKLPPQKSRFWGAIPKKFWGFGASPSKNPPKKPKIGGILGQFPPKNRQLQPCLCRFPPPAAMCGKES